MSMSEDTENFEQLRRLLALKRHDQPPPGYFNDFSRQVILRIRAGERGGEVTILEQFSWEAPWLQRIWAALETKPILAGAFGLGLCSLLIAGVVFADKGDIASGALATPMDAASLPIVQASIGAVEVVDHIGRIGAGPKEVFTKILDIRVGPKWEVAESELQFERHWKIVERVHAFGPIRIYRDLGCLRIEAVKVVIGI